MRPRHGPRRQSHCPAFRVSQRLVNVSASIGVTLYPNDSADSDTLLRHADQAMYAAKQARPQPYHLLTRKNDRRAGPGAMSWAVSAPAWPRANSTSLPT
jgi:GGDEF domain-containing protein